MHTRLIDAPLKQTLNRLRAIVRRADELVVEVLIKLKDPSFELRQDAAERECEVSRLKRELQEEAAFTFARFPPVANDLRLLVTIMSVAADLVHMVGFAGRIREQASEIGRPSANLLRLALVTQRQASECFAAVVFHFEDVRDGSREKVATERLEAIVATRREAARLFRRVITEPAPVNPSQLELEGAVADELERISSLAAEIIEQLLVHRMGHR